MTLRDIAAVAGKTGGPIAGYARINAAGAAPSFATHIADVEVDPETGKASVVRYTAIQDAGRAIHPSYVEGQYQGGVAQGIGWALNEEFIYDAKGQLDNPTFLDYRMPVTSDLPMLDAVMIEIPNPKHPQGVRGVGEVPLVPVMAAVGNAIHGAGQRGIAEVDCTVQVKDKSVNTYGHIKTASPVRNALSFRSRKLGEFAKIFTK